MKYEHKKQFEAAGFKEVEIIVRKRYGAKVSRRNIQNLNLVFALWFLQGN